MRRLGVLGHRTGVEAGRIDIQAAPWLDQIGDDQANDQCERREDEKIAERLGRDPADPADVAHPGDSGDDGQEDDRRDDHLHQFDEAITQRLQALTEGRPEVTYGPAEHDGDQHLEIEVPIEGPARDGRRL
ncbi:hypothetical protein D3C80_1618940 [compost metagenome]